MKNNETGMVKSLRTCQNRGRKRKMGEGVAEPRRCPISGRIWKEPKYEDHLPPRTDSNNNSRVQKRTPRGLDRTGTLVLILFLFFSLRPSRSIYQSRLTVSRDIKVVFQIQIQISPVYFIFPSRLIPPRHAVFTRCGRQRDPRARYTG